MILTKDNLLNFIKEHGAITPTQVAENFETTTMIASAAISELVKSGEVGITHLKVGSTPYYYDKENKETLIEVAKNHLSKYDREVFDMLMENQILNDNRLSPQHKLAVARIKDFAIPLELEHDGEKYKFWVWYLRDLDETRKQIINALENQKNQSSPQINEEKTKEDNKTPGEEKQPKQEGKKDTSKSESPKKEKNEQQTLNNYSENKSEEKQNNITNKDEGKVEEIQEENYIEEYLKDKNFRVESKNKDDKGIFYEVTLNISGIKIHIDCYYFYKKPKESDIIRFYTSNIKPKIIFIRNPPKKLYSLAESLENLEVVNV